MKRTILTIGLALLVSFAFVSGVMAQSQQKPAPAATAPAATIEKFSGAIDKIDGAKKEFVVKQGKDQKSFYWDDHTKFMQGDKAMSFSDLKKGTDVTVEYSKAGAKLTAERVDISMAKTSS